MKHLLVLVLATAIGCGGGGGGSTAGGGGGPLPGQAAAQQILETCGQSALSELLQDLELFRAVLDGGAFPPFQVTGIDAGNVSVGWSVDLDADAQPDLIGTLQFLDATGTPSVPFSLDQLLGGFDSLADLLNGLEDGAQVVVAFNAPDGTLNAAAGFTFQIGVPETADLQLNTQETDCAATLQADDLGVPSGPADFPDGTVQLELQTPDGTLAGTITFDGTNAATADVGISGDNFVFLVDLDTFAVTPAP